MDVEKRLGEICYTVQMFAALRRFAILFVHRPVFLLARLGTVADYNRAVPACSRKLLASITNKTCIFTTVMTFACVMCGECVNFKFIFF